MIPTTRASSLETVQTLVDAGLVSKEQAIEVHRLAEERSQSPLQVLLDTAPTSCVRRRRLPAWLTST